MYDYCEHKRKLPDPILLQFIQNSAFQELVQRQHTITVDADLLLYPGYMRNFFSALTTCQSKAILFFTFLLYIHHFSSAVMILTLDPHQRICYSLTIIEVHNTLGKNFSLKATQKRPHSRNKTAAKLSLTSTVKWLPSALASIDPDPLHSNVW